MNFFEKFNNYKERINKKLMRLIHQLPFKNLRLNHAIKYGLLDGKKIRPILVYAAGEMLNVKLKDLDVPAAAIECIHAYSLMHDDLPAMDNDQLRRGKPTCHIAFGEDIAILAGNSLQALAFSILANEPMPDVFKEKRIKMIFELAQSTGIAGLAGGQALELELQQKKINLIALKKIHHYKTACLIRTALRLAVFSSDQSDDKYLPDLDEYAQAIGLAFQIQDDILDFGNDKKKTLQNTTYQSLIGIKNTKKEIVNLYKKAMNALNNLEKKQSLKTIFLKEFTNFIIKREK